MKGKERDTLDLGSEVEWKANGQPQDPVSTTSELIDRNEVIDPNSAEVPDLPERKDLAGLGITIEIADLERDSEAVARIFSQRSVTPHLSGVTPQMLDEREYQRLRRQYNVPILAATPEGVRGYYRRNRGEKLLVAKDRSGNVVGTTTLQVEGSGVLALMVAKLAVEDAVDENKKEKYRRRHTGRDLVVKACDMAFGNPHISHVDAAVIVGIEGDEAPLNLFRKLGFDIDSTRQERALSWDPDLNQFLVKPVVRMAVYRDKYFANRPQTSS